MKGGGVLAAMDMIVSSFDDKTAKLFSPLFHRILLTPGPRDEEEADS